MSTRRNWLIATASLFSLCAALALAVAVRAQNVKEEKKNEILGEVQFVGAKNADKTSGVWIDGGYVGYVKELMRDTSKKILLLPGEHEISVRQSGYKDFNQKIIVEPGKKLVIPVAMELDPEARLPTKKAELKISVKPDRAAVFLDDQFVGHAHQFGGPGRAMLLSPGKHRIKVALPGYRTFETEMNMLANQKYEVKTQLPKGSITQAPPVIKQP